MKIIILVPIYNDWQSASKLIEEINSIVSGLDIQFSVIIVNDASSEQQAMHVPNIENLQSVKIINMKENRGHTRCIASGLKYIFEKEEFDYVIPMDGDGEDRPEEIKNFLDYIRYTPDKLIVGERVKRSENLINIPGVVNSKCLSKKLFSILKLSFKRKKQKLVYILKKKI